MFVCIRDKSFLRSDCKENYTGSEKRLNPPSISAPANVLRNEGDELCLDALALDWRDDKLDSSLRKEKDVLGSCPA